MRIAILALLWAGCGGASTSCEQIAAQVRQSLDSGKVCQTDSDCTFAETSCGLPDECGSYVNRRTADALATQTADWSKSGCLDGCVSAPCAPPTSQTGHCHAGTCGE